MPFEPPLRRGKARTRARRIALAAVAIVAAGIGIGAYYLLAVYAPGEQRGVAQAEILRWEERLAAARECLLGAGPPPAPTLREALAIRELSPDPWSRGTCTQLIGQLARGETEDTGLPDVEEAWRGIERAVGKIGTAFLAHVDPAGEARRAAAAARAAEEAATRKAAAARTGDATAARGAEAAGSAAAAAAATTVDPLAALPAALDEIDAAAAALRAAAGLPAPPARPASPPLPIAEIIPLRDGDRPVHYLDTWITPSMSAAVMFGSAGDHELQLTLTPGAPPLVRVVGSGVLRAFPDSTWGARGWLEQIVIGAIDETGGLAGDAGPLAEPGGGAATTGAGRAGPRIIKVGGTGRVFAVLGTPDDGIIIGGGMHSLVLVRSRAGKLTADKPQLISQIAYSIDPTGRALVAYNDDGAFGAPLDVVPDPSTGNFGKLHAFVARGAAPARVVDLGETQVGGACFTARRGWIAAADSVQPEGAVPIVSFDLESGAAAPQALPEHDLIGCTADAALLQQRNTSRYAVCTDAGCRAASLPGMQPSKHAALAGDELVGIVHRDRVLGVWREKGPPRYFTVRAPLSSLQLALSDGKVLDVVAQSDAGAVIVRVPAR